VTLPSAPVVVTGAAGFVGRAVVAHLVAQGMAVRAVVRMPPAAPIAGAEVHPMGTLVARTDWQPVLAGARAVVHCAARAHKLADSTSDPLADFRAENCDITTALAEQCASAGVGRFVFLSTIGVLGAQTFGRPFRAGDPPAPHSDYARSKHEAEQSLQTIAARTGLELVVIRPPLVYGPGAPGNFGAMVRAVARGWPLPLGAITHNRRSLVAIDNLVDLVAVALSHPSAPGRVLLPCDGEDLSTAALVRRLALALRQPARLVPVPERWLTAAFRLAGREQTASQLCGSLQIDPTESREVLSWRPPVDIDEALRRIRMF